MAVRIVDGVPGSGKTYYCVHHMLKTYFVKKDGWYVPKPIKPVFEYYVGEVTPKITIITNITELKLPHKSLNDEIQKAGGPEIYFSMDYQTEIEEKHEKTVYIIDEAQKIFRTKLKGDWDGVFSYFEEHRKFGHDVYLITQNIKKINTQISLLAEIKINAKARIRSLTGEFPYRVISENDVMKKFSLRPDQEIFALYSSMRKTESEKIRNPVVKTVGIVMAISFLCMYLGYRYLNGMMSGGKGKAHAATIEENQKTQYKTNDDKSKYVLTPTRLPQNTNKKVNASGDRDPQLLIPVSSLTEYHDGRLLKKYFVLGQIYNYSELPFRVKNIGSRMYVVLYKSELDVIDSDYNGPSIPVNT